MGTPNNYYNLWNITEIKKSGGFTSFLEYFISLLFLQLVDKFNFTAINKFYLNKNSFFIFSKHIALFSSLLKN